MRYFLPVKVFPVKPVWCGGWEFPVLSLGVWAEQPDTNHPSTPDLKTGPTSGNSWKLAKAPYRLSPVYQLCCGWLNWWNIVLQFMGYNLPPFPYLSLIFLQNSGSCEQRGEAGSGLILGSGEQQADSGLRGRGLSLHGGGCGRPPPQWCGPGWSSAACGNEAELCFSGLSSSVLTGLSFSSSLLSGLYSSSVLSGLSFSSSVLSGLALASSSSCTWCITATEMTAPPEKESEAFR